MASVQNRTWQGPPHFVVKEFPAENPGLVDYVGDMIRCEPCIVVHRKESALVESDEWTDSWGFDVAEGYCLDIE